MKPRIIHLGKFYPPASGGIETHLQTLALSQARLGAEVTVLCVNHANAAHEHVNYSRLGRTESVEEFDGPVRVVRIGRVASLARMDVCPQLLGELRRKIGRGVDVIHLHTPNPTMLIALALAWPRADVVVTHHSDVVKQRWLRHAVTPFERRVYSRAAAILTQSPLCLAGSATLRRYEKKVVALPLGIDLAPFLHPSAAAREMGSQFRQKLGEPIWLMVGRLVYYKGIEVALRALTQVNGRLLIIGTGPLGIRLRQLADTLGVADRVLWLGHASGDELIGAYRAATALWFPSVARSEAYGLAQVEALASECPVLNTSIPYSGAPWVSPHDQTGLTVPVNDAPALALAARRLLDEPGLRERFARQGRERAIACFAQEQMAAKSLEIYQAYCRTNGTHRRWL